MPFRRALKNITRQKRYRQFQGSVALLTLIPLLVTSAIANRPVFTTDLWHRVYARGFHMIDMVRPRPDQDAYRQELGAYLVRHQSVDRYRLHRDISYLRSLGWQITGRDLFFMTRVVAGEAGNYYHRRNYRQSQRTDMEAIAYAIIDRYAAAKANACLRRMYIGGKGVTLYNVVMHDLQFSIANSKRRRRRWHSAFQRSQLLHGVKDRGKFLQAYAAVVEALIGATRSLEDPTGGSVNYKNNAVWYAGKKKWDGSPACGFTLKRVGNIEAHTHYALADRAGKNPVRAYRRALLST